MAQRKSSLGIYLRALRTVFNMAKIDRSLYPFGEEKSGSTLKTLPKNNKALLEDLRGNIYMFSAAKTFQQVLELNDKLIDEHGTVRPFNEFKKDADRIFDTYDKDYLKTEYDTAIGQGLMANQWQRIQREKDILPYLQYSTIGDPCDICAPLDGLTAPVDDPIWDTIMPMNHFNCGCIVEQLDKEEGEASATKNISEITGPAIDKMSDAFKINPGKDGYVFSLEHPYFTVPKKYKELAEKNFNLKIPKDDTK